MMQADGTSALVKCYYSKTLKGMFESVGKITLDRMVFYILFKEKDLRLVVKDSSGLFNSIIINKSMFEESYMKKERASDNSYLVKLDFKDFISMLKFLIQDALLTIEFNEEKGKVYFRSEEETDKYVEVRKLKLLQLKNQTQISLSASYPDEEDCIGEIRFNNTGALAFKGAIDKTFSSKHKYLLFHFNTERSHLMITNDEIKDGELEQYDFVCHIFPNEAVKGSFKTNSSFRYYYSYKLIHYVTGFLNKDCSILMKIYSSGALCFSNHWNTNIEVSTILPASSSDNDHFL